MKGKNVPAFESGSGEAVQNPPFSRKFKEESYPKPMEVEKHSEKQ